MKRFLIIIWSLISVSVFNCQTASKKNTAQISPKQFKLILDNEFQIVDVRTEAEFKTGYIEKAENINFFDKNFLNTINKLNKEKPVLIYCQSGKRSEKSVELFKKAGFVKIYDLQGGIVNWKSEGFKVVKPK